MVQLRRWLLNSSFQVSLFGTLLLTGAAGCQSTRDYAASVDSSSQWSAPTIIEPEATPPVLEARPTPVAPYEETPAVVPGPEALFESVSPAPAADLGNVPAKPRRRGTKQPETFVVDDVAPAPEPSIGPEPARAGTTGLPNDLEPRTSSDVISPLPANGTEEPAASVSTTPVELPVPERSVSAAAAPPETTAVSDELPSETLESAIPGLPAETDPVPVLPNLVEPAVTVPSANTPAAEEIEENVPADSDTELTPSPESAGVRPLFPEVGPARKVVVRKTPERGAAVKARTQAGESRPAQGLPSAIELPDPMPVTPASSASSTVGAPGVSSADVSARTLTIATLDSEVSGVAFDQHGNLFVTSEEGLSRISPTGSRQDFAVIESPRGFVALPDGSFAVCDARQRVLLRVDRTGGPIEFLAQRSDGHFLRAPSFVAVDSNGGVYFSDPGYARITAPTGRLHYVSADGEVNLVSQHLAYPQGVAISTDGAKLFLVESQENRVVEFEILSPGRVGPASEISRLAPKSGGDSNDFATGLAVARDGQLFVARHGMQRVDVLSANGQFVRSIDVPNVLANSVVLSDDQSSLFVGGAAANAQWSGVVVRVPVTTPE